MMMLNVINYLQMWWTIHLNALFAIMVLQQIKTYCLLQSSNANDSLITETFDKLNLLLKYNRSAQIGWKINSSHELKIVYWYTDMYLYI